MPAAVGVAAGVPVLNGPGLGAALRGQGSGFLFQRQQSWGSVEDGTAASADAEWGTVVFVLGIRVLVLGISGVNVRWGILRYRDTTVLAGHKCQEDNVER
ncbi:hypothetical protein A3850_012570 [Lewinella sp. 4G2]|nr:hypothetical protein A3850_012570 [Lewinella sp. 4G2]